MAKEKLFPVGIDIGSLNARIAISEPTDTGTSINKKDGDSGERAYQYVCPSQPTIIANEAGSRETLALSIPEPSTDADPYNDQFWDNNNNKSNKNKKKENDKEEVNYIFGEAARRSLNRDKKPLASSLIRSLSSISIDDNDDNTGENNGDGEDSEKEDPLKATTAFFQHLTTQTTNATSAHPSSLRLVLSVPNHASPTLTSNLIASAQAGINSAISNMGWDTLPMFTSPSAATSSLNKKEKKALIKKSQAQNRVLSVINEASAVCYAHFLYQSSPSPPTNTNTYKNILVMDWGASSLKLTHLTQTPNGILTIVQNQTSPPSYSGTAIKKTLMSHCAELFERKHRIPSGEVMLNKKAVARLDVAADGALRTLSRGLSPKVQVTVDGLYEGMDMHVEVMLARFEMLCAGILRGAEGLMRGSMVNVDGGGFDAVLTSGNVMNMPAVKKMVDRVFDPKSCWRGRSIGDVPPEEAVAMGCAMYAETLVSSYCADGLFPPKEEEEECNDDDDAGGYCCHVPTEANVMLSPLSVGLSLQEGDPAAVLLIESGTPLPAHVTQDIDLTGCSSSSKKNGSNTVSLGIVQVLPSSAAGGSQEKILGRIEGIDAALKEIEITAELSCEGKLTMAINGGPIVAF